MKFKDYTKYIAAPLKTAATVIMLLFIVCFLQAMIASILGEVLEKYVYHDKIHKESQKELETPEWKIAKSSKNFLPDGTIHLVYETDEYKGGFSDEYKVEQIYDVNNNLIWDGIRKDRPYEYLSWSFNQGRSFTLRNIIHELVIGTYFSTTLEIPVRQQKKLTQIWRYEPKSDLFVGYSVKRSKIGYFGSTGFAKSRSQAKPFGPFRGLNAWMPEDSYSPVLLWQTDKRIYQIDLEKQQVKVVFQSPQGNIEFVYLHGWSLIKSDLPADTNIKYRPMIHCRTEGRNNYLIMQDTGQILKLNIPEDADEYGFRLTTATDKGVFLYSTSGGRIKPTVDYYESPETWQKWWEEYDSKPQKMAVGFYKMNDNGSFDLVNRFEWIRPATHIVAQNDYWLMSKSYVTIVSPPLYDLTYRLFPRQLRQLSRDFNRNFSLSSGYADIIMEFRPTWRIFNLTLSVLMMGFVFWHGWSRRTGWLKFIFWIILTGLFNLAGLLAYLALNHTPLIKCSLCGKKRNLQRNDCVSCDSPLPEPLRRNIDLIFDS